MKKRRLRRWLSVTLLGLPAVTFVSYSALDNVGAVIDTGARLAWTYDPLDPSVWSRMISERMLKHQSPGVRVQAARDLQGLGFHARPAVPALIDALKDDDEMVRDAARESLREIAPELELGMSVDGLRP